LILTQKQQKINIRGPDCIKKGEECPRPVPLPPADR